MYCYKCGKEIPDESVFCSFCGTNLKSTTAESNASLEAEGNRNEHILMSGLCNHVKSSLWVQNGNAILTNKRFIYLKHSILLEAFVNLTKENNGFYIPVDDYKFDIPVDDILGIEDGRHGISKTIIINTSHSEKYNFYFTKREQWKIAFQNVMNR